MNKRIKILIIVVVVIVCAIIGVLYVRNATSKKYEITKYNLSIEVPYKYKKESSTDNELLVLSNSENTIEIVAMDFIDDFWSSGDSMSRMDEYMKVISAKYFDVNISNVKTEILESSEGKIARVDMELSTPSISSKGIALITNDEIGNVVMQITGSKEDMQNDEKEIERIIKSLKINK